jgi:DNA-binding GntR family transcriptional regulator
VLHEIFHWTLAEAADKANVWRFVEGLKSQMDRVRFLSFSLFPTTKLIEQHKEIVDSIETGDVRQAEMSIRVHLNEILTDLPAIQAENPDFFVETQQ